MKKILALVLIGLTASGTITQTQTEDALKAILAEEPTNAVSDSLFYKVGEIERHIHSAGSWFGLSATAGGTTNAVDRIGTSQAPIQLDAGNEDWGSWVLVFGSNDTPTADRMGGAATHFDPHLMLVVDAEAATTYFIQFSRGASGDAGISAGTYTELAIGVDVANRPFSTETEIQTGRAPSGALVWARCLAVGENTATIDFYVGIHEYSE